MMSNLAVISVCCFLAFCATPSQGQKRANLAFPFSPAFQGNCKTKQGESGRCLFQFDCPFFKKEAGRNYEKTECNKLFNLVFYCCPSGGPRVVPTPSPSPTPAPISNDPFEKLRVSNCGVRPAKLLGGDTLLRLAKREATELKKKEAVFVPLVVGGIEADKNSWPWMTAIYMKNRGRSTFLCGAAIISQRYVISAAHCFKVNRNTVVSPGRFVVRFAEHNLFDTNKGDEYAIEDIIVHDGYVPPADYNDIALIKLKQPIRFHNKVKPICMPVEERTTNFEDKIATVIGWGVTEFAGRDSAVLRQVGIPISSNSFCDEQYTKIKAVRDYPKGIINSQVCAGFKKGGKDACQGDSGGPLMIKDRSGKWNLVGIVSGGYQCARPNFPGVYTRVTHYLSWVVQNMD